MVIQLTMFISNQYGSICISVRCIYFSFGGFRKGSYVVCCSLCIPGHSCFKCFT